MCLETWFYFSFLKSFYWCIVASQYVLVFAVYNMILNQGWDNGETREGPAGPHSPPPAPDLSRQASTLNALPFPAAQSGVQGPSSPHIWHRGGPVRCSGPAQTYRFQTCILTRSPSASQQLASEDLCSTGDRPAKRRPSSARRWVTPGEQGSPHHSHSPPGASWGPVLSLPARLSAEHARRLLLVTWVWGIGGTRLFRVPRHSISCPVLLVSCFACP